MTDTDQESETCSEEETERREAALKRMLATPHKPHKTKDSTKAPHGTTKFQ